MLDGGKLLLTVGDHDHNGWQRARILAQDPDAQYGKTILIDPATGASEIYTSGHRNPQGLFHDGQGTTWLTEHGPEGGDELNVLAKGKNFGWPYATYGTASGLKTWPLNTSPGQHVGYEAPIFSWLPDIAISDLVRIEGRQFRLWRGDLLVGSFKRTLSRVHVEDGRVVFAEPIEIRGSDARIRDVLEDSDGRIVLWIDGASLAVLTPIPEDDGKSPASASTVEARGQLLFARCAGCHQVKDGTVHGIGPDLFGIVGRRIAGAPGFSYSPALANRSGTWTEASLDEFLANPALFAPGTSMQFEGIPEASDRARILHYLKTLR